MHCGVIKKLRRIELKESGKSTRGTVVKIRPGKRLSKLPTLFKMTDQMRKMLDELMGTQRDGKIFFFFAFTKNASMSSLSQ